MNSERQVSHGWRCTVQKLTCSIQNALFKPWMNELQYSIRHKSYQPHSHTHNSNNAITWRHKQQPQTNAWVGCPIYRRIVQNGTEHSARGRYRPLIASSVKQHMGQSCPNRCLFLCVHQHSTSTHAQDISPRGQGSHVRVSLLTFWCGLEDLPDPVRLQNSGIE